MSGLATSRPILLLVTTTSFLLLTLSTGQVIHYLLLSSPSVSRAVLAPAPKSGNFLYSNYDTWDDGPVIIVGGGGALIYDVVLGAIQTFAGVAQRFVSSDKNTLFIDSLPNSVAASILGLVIRFLLGLAVLGSLSFLSLLLSLSLFAPLQIFNGFRGAGLFRRHARREGGGGSTNGTGLGQIMIITFVLIGAANTLISVYGGVQGLTRRLLMFVETQILEVNPDDRRKAQENGRARKMESWWSRWVREGRWRRPRGWYELGVRGWSESRGRVIAAWERARVAEDVD